MDGTKRTEKRPRKKDERASHRLEKGSRTCMSLREERKGNHATLARGICEDSEETEEGAKRASRVAQGTDAKRAQWVDAARPGQEASRHRCT